MKASSLFLSILTIGFAASASAHVEIYFSPLSGLQESPPNASPGTGSATVTLDLDTLLMRVQANFSGLTGPTSAAHIHVRAAGSPNGGVATQTPSFSGFPLGVTSGSMDTTFDMALASSYNPAFVTANGGTVSGAFNAFVLALREDRAYFNVHTSTFPGGEIRGNLDLVPEPATMAALGLGAAVLVRRRRK